MQWQSVSQAAVVRNHPEHLDPETMRYRRVPW